MLFLILAFLSTFLGFLISAAIYYILMRTLVRPTNTNFYTTCVISYTSVVELLIWILVVGLLASLYGLYPAFVGIREMHETTIG